MGCFTLAWFEQVCIWFVIVCAIIGLIRLLIPFLISKLGGGDLGILGQALNIVLWAVICIYVIYIVFALIGCLIGMGGGLSLMPHR